MTSTISTAPTAFLFLTRDAATGLERLEVPEQPITIGTLAGTGLTLVGDDVGPVHAAVERGPDGNRLRRLSRVRPLRVNGHDVAIGELGNGDRVELGSTELLYVEAPEIAPEMLKFVLSRADEEIQIELPVAGTLTVVGRMEGDILVDDDSVSSRHLEIENFGDGLRWVRDLGSTNGSELNGEPLGTIRRPLADGDELTIGRVRIKVNETGEPPGITSVVQRTVMFVPDSAMA